MGLLRWGLSRKEAARKPSKGSSWKQNAAAGSREEIEHEVMQISKRDIFSSFPAKSIKSCPVRVNALGAS